MEWERNGPNRPGGVRQAGWLLLALGVVMLAAGIVLAFTFGTILTLILLAGSVFVNTAAVICFRHGRERPGGNKQ